MLCFGVLINEKFKSSGNPSLWRIHVMQATMFWQIFHKCVAADIIGSGPWTHHLKSNYGSSRRSLSSPKQSCLDEMSIWITVLADATECQGERQVPRGLCGLGGPNGKVEGPSAEKTAALCLACFLFLPSWVSETTTKVSGSQVKTYWGEKSIVAYLSVQL